MTSPTNTSFIVESSVSRSRALRTYKEGVKSPIQEIKNIKKPARKTTNHCLCFGILSENIQRLIKWLSRIKKRRRNCKRRRASAGAFFCNTDLYPAINFNNRLRRFLAQK